MPVGTKATVKSLDPDEVREPRRADHARQHLPPPFPAGRGADRASSAGCTAFMAWERPDPHRLGRLPGLLAAGHAARRRRRRRHLPQRLRREREPVHAGARGRDPAHLGSDIAMCLDQVPPAGVVSARPRGSRPRGRPSGPAASATRRAPTASSRFGISQGGVDPELRRRSIEEIAELDFDGNAIGGLAIGEERERDVRGDRLRCRAAAGRQAALLHGASATPKESSR